MDGKLRLVVDESGLKDFSQYKLNLFKEEEEKPPTNGNSRKKGRDNKPYKRQLSKLRRMFS